MDHNVDAEYHVYVDWKQEPKASNGAIVKTWTAKVSQFRRAPKLSTVNAYVHVQGCSNLKCFRETCGPPFRVIYV